MHRTRRRRAVGRRRPGDAGPDVDELRTSAGGRQRRRRRRGGVPPVGTTSTSAIDPVAAVADLRRSTAPGCTSMRPRPEWPRSARAARGADGCDRADSFVINPHKWLLAMDCSLLGHARDAAARSRWCPNTCATRRRSQVLMDYRAHPLGRRFRALKLWMVIRSYGLLGPARRTSRRASTRPLRFAGLVRADERSGIVTEQLLGRRRLPAARATTRAPQRLMDAVDASRNSVPLPRRGRGPHRAAARHRRLADHGRGHRPRTSAALVDELEGLDAWGSSASTPAARPSRGPGSGGGGRAGLDGRARKKEKPSAFSLNFGSIRCGFWLWTLRACHPAVLSSSPARPAWRR